MMTFDWNALDGGGLAANMRTGGLVLREPAVFHEPTPLSERLAQVLWQEQLFSPKNLRTTDGRRLRVIHPGTWNMEGGPDFARAEIELDGSVCRGDVEVHLRGNDWHAHGHERNPAYNRVVLDVSLWAGGGVEHPPRRADGETLPQLVLSPFLECALEELQESLDPDRYPFALIRLARPANAFQHMSKEEVLRWVEEEGMRRMAQKSGRAGELVSRFGANQAAYLLMAESLGYKHNKAAFFGVAAAVPLRRLLARNDPDRMIEMLLAECGRLTFRVFQVRPANHPERRLAALALLAHSRPDLAGWFEMAVNAANPDSLRPVLRHPFWSCHARRGGPLIHSPMALIGQERWREMLVNVIIPFCHSRRMMAGDGKGVGEIERVYRERAASPGNCVTRRMAYELGVALPRLAWLQQGLIQIERQGNFPAPAIRENGPSPGLGD
ncbi:MAG: DUF2851 family protein [Verrucomicrobiae bacterium]|nr:DUF2851 family protein [Verrucomicrobiae bacterium]